MFLNSHSLQNLSYAKVSFPIAHRCVFEIDVVHAMNVGPEDVCRGENLKNSCPEERIS